MMKGGEDRAERRGGNFRRNDVSFRVLKSLFIF